MIFLLIFSRLAVRPGARLNFPLLSSDIIAPVPSLSHAVRTVSCDSDNEFRISANAPPLQRFHVIASGQEVVVSEVSAGRNIDMPGDALKKEENTVDLTNDVLQDDFFSPIHLIFG
jgi:hypothetical protein